MDGILEAVKKDPAPIAFAILSAVVTWIGHLVTVQVTKAKADAKQSDADADTQTAYVKLTTEQIEDLKGRLTSTEARLNTKITTLNNTIDEMSKRHAATLSERDKIHAAEIEERKRIHAAELAVRDEALRVALLEKEQLKVQLSNLQTVLLDQGAQLVRLTQRLNGSSASVGESLDTPK